MSNQTIKFAAEFLESDKDQLADLQVHQFKDDMEAHDDSAIDRLYAEFNSDYERARVELAAIYGEPSREGTDNDEVIPLNGVFRYSVWQIDGKSLFVAAAHEDRGCPILLMLGTVSLS
jgi:hypothetical protein